MAICVKVDSFENFQVKPKGSRILIKSVNYLKRKIRSLVDSIIL